MRYIARAADGLAKVVFPVSRAANVVGTAALVVLVIVTVAEIISRRAFHAPITGATEFILLCFALVIFMMLAKCAMEDGHLVVTLLTHALPKRVQRINAVVMHIITIGILSLASWQLLVYAGRVRRMGAIAAIINVPIYPFVYLAALSFILLTLVYLIKLLHTISEVT